MIQNGGLTIPQVIPCLGEGVHMTLNTLGEHMFMALDIASGNIARGDIARGNERSNLPLRMRYVESFAKAYNFPLSVQGGEADAAAQGAFFRQFADGIRPHFSTAVKYVAGHDVVNLFNAHGLSDVNFPDLVAAGLVTAEAAKDLERSVADHAYRMVKSGLTVFEKRTKWSYLLKSGIAYAGIFGGLLCLSKFILGNAEGSLAYASNFAMLGTFMAMALNRYFQFVKHDKKSADCAAGLAALLGAHAAFGVKTDEPEKGPKVVLVG